MHGGVLLDCPGGPDMSDSSSQHDVGCGSEPVFQENAMTVAGLQHIISNLNNDVHASLSHWSVYYAQLKTLECFLRVEERRQRFVDLLAWIASGRT